jgi:hypothetical protein
MNTKKQKMLLRDGVPVRFDFQIDKHVRFERVINHFLFLPSLISRGYMPILPWITRLLSGKFGFYFYRRDLC